MPEDLDPIVGNWYRHLDKGQKFEVVSVDEDAKLVELQHFDGDLEEVELEAWYEMEIEGIEPPEDWTGPVDDLEPDDLQYTETDMSDDDWSEAYSELNQVRQNTEDPEEES